MPEKKSKVRQTNRTAKKRSTASPEASAVKGRLEAILGATTEGYWDWKVSTGEVYYGQGWLSSLGYHADDLPKDQSFLDSMIHPDDLNAFETQLREHLEGLSASLDCECRLRAKSGNYKWFRMRAKVVQRNSKQVPLRMVGTVLDIERRVQAQAELEKSQAQLEALFQSTADSIWSVDPQEFRLLTFNQSFENFMIQSTGVKPHIGALPEELGAPERAEKWRILYSQALRDGEVDCDYQLVTGTILHVIGRTLTRDGRPFAISIFGHDITERKQMELALRQSEEKFAKAFMASPMGLTLTSAHDHRYLEVNEFFEKTTGYRRDEVIGKTPFDLNLWANPEQRRVLVQEILERGALRNLELQFRTKSGEIRYGLGSADLIEIDGEPCVLSVTQDITERKRAEQALVESEQRLRIAVEAGNMYAFEWDIASDLIQHSQESSRVLKWSNSGQHRKSEFIANIHPEDCEHYRKVIESLSPKHPSYKVLFRFQHTDRTFSWLEESGRGFFGPDDKLQRIVGIAADVTEARESERALRELSGRLITSQEEERRRVARELHDNIGQELALLAAQSQRVESGVSQQENTLHLDVHEIYKRVKEIATKVSKLSHRLHSSELDFLGLGIAVDRLCRDFSSQYGIDADYVVKNVPPDLDRSIALCFYRVTQEALQNVAKHSHAKLVRVQLSAEAGELTLIIQDDGIGFDPEKARFQSGLGLISMRERMNVIGGQCTISSKMGTGTEVQAVVSFAACAAP